MKRVYAIFAVVVLAASTALAERWEVHINIPGSGSKTLFAEVEMRHSPILKITTDWGDVYVTHFSNVVLVKRVRRN